MKKHSIKLEDEEISAVHTSGNSEKWMFFCHGFADTKERSMQPLAKKFNERGFNTVVFDFRGNGESSREFQEATLTSRIEDLNAVIDYFGPEKCFVYGTSFGAKVALHTAVENDQIDVLVTKAPVTYNQIMDKFRKIVEEQGEAEFYDKKFGQKFFDDLDSYSFEKVIEKLEVPTAIFHGSDDTTVHLENSIEALKGFETESCLYKMKGEEHSFSEKSEERLIELSVAWIESFVN